MNEHFFFIFFYKDLPLQGSAGKAHHILRRKELCPADTQFANPGVPSNIYSREPVNMITAPPLPPPATLCDWKGSRLRNIKKEKKRVPGESANEGGILAPSLLIGVPQNK